MKVDFLPLLLCLDGNSNYWNTKRAKMLPNYLRIPIDENGDISDPSNKQIKIWQARAAWFNRPLPK